LADIGFLANDGGVRVPSEAADERITYNPVSEADLATLLRLVRALHQEEGHSLDAAGESAVRNIARGEPLARAWIMRFAGQPVGYLVITLGYSIEYGGRDGFIDELYLLPDVRGRALGRKLLAFALEQAAQLGIETLHLEVEIGNENATRLYRSAGFRETGRRLMRLPLSKTEAVNT
jgi:ribosomal protein S18 acetylase RimI-like enzyme